jgi:predicted alpha-1,2-mannosidase
MGITVRRAPLLVGAAFALSCGRSEPTSTEPGPAEPTGDAEADASADDGAAPDADAVRDASPAPAICRGYSVEKSAFAAVGARASSADNPFGVNPFIGTAGDANTHPGAMVPWGMVSVVPHTRPPESTRTAPYVYQDAPIYGFGHVQLSGVGCPDLGNVLLMATTGNVRTTEPGYASAYDAEDAHPGYYTANLKSWGVRAEVTATTRAGMSRFTFPVRSGDANVLIDVSHALTPAKSGAVTVVSKSEIEGMVESGGFCGSPNKQKVHFVARFSKPAASRGTWTGAGCEAATPDLAQTGSDIGAYMRFDTSEGEPIVVKVGISYVSIDNARANLDAEIPGWDFDAVKAAAEQAWAAELGKIAVTGGTAEDRTIFYTGLYHALVHPNVFQDVNGQYVGMRGSGIKTAVGYDRYTVFSLWDTYRNLHPLLSLVYPKRQLDMVKTMVEMSKESGWLPKWELAGNETHVMVGDPAAIVVADTYLRGIRDFDVDAAWTAIMKQATQASDNDIRPANGAYLQYGYIPYDLTGDWVWGAVSTTLEYDVADFAAGRLASALGKTAEADEFARRSSFYRNLFDASSGFLRAKKKDGTFLDPFDSLAQCCDKSWEGSGGPGYVEGNAWQYTFFVPHDVAGLRDLFGGDAPFVAKLQEAFDKGYFALSNEPDMAYPYLFDEIPGQAWRTQELTRAMLARYYTTKANGIPGNDDTGTLSAYCLWGAMGLYPSSPASSLYALTTPVFEKIVVALDSSVYAGSSLTIQTVNASADNKYIQSKTWNGAPISAAMLDHANVTAGGTLVLELGPLPASADAGP